MSTPVCRSEDASTSFCCACELIASVAQEELKEAQERFTQIEQQVGGLAQWATRQEGFPRG